MSSPYFKSLKDEIVYLRSKIEKLEAEKGKLEGEAEAVETILDMVVKASENIRNSVNVLVRFSMRLGVPESGGAVVRLYGEMVRYIYEIIQAAERRKRGFECDIDQITRRIREAEMQIEWREKELGELSTESGS